MKKFVIGYINFYDNDLILELIKAKNEHEARWKHSKLQDDCWDTNKDQTACMDAVEFQQWCFDSDMLVSSLEIS